MIQRRVLLAAAIAIAATPAVTMPAMAQAGTWPNRYIRFIVPYAPGGPGDAQSRYVAKGMEEVLGTPVVVENMGGAGGSIGMMQIARGAPDGHVVGLGPVGTVTTTPQIQKDIGYDPFKDLLPVAKISEYNNVLMVNARSPYKTLNDLVAAAKANPNTITYGTTGPGSTSHLYAEMLARELGIQLVHVPYKGYAPARTDLLAGHIDFMFDVWSSATADYIKSGMLHAVGTTVSTSGKSAQNIPTLPGSLPPGWTGIFTSAGTPPELVGRLSKAIEHALSRADSIAAMNSFGYEAAFSSGDSLAATMRKDYDRFGAVIKELGLDAK